MRLWRRRKRRPWIPPVMYVGGERVPPQIVTLAAYIQQRPDPLITRVAGKETSERHGGLAT